MRPILDLSFSPSPLKSATETSSPSPMTSSSSPTTAADANPPSHQGAWLLLWGKALDLALVEHDMDLDVDALDGIDEEEGNVAKTSDGGDLIAKVDVAGGFDEVHLVAIRH
ncbi:hypothetical protein GYH30_054875 [Glycine max]|nr:hypothetical protein GYH30_054875 [Glycine max]